MVDRQQQKVCFGTLALGNNYRILAALLAEDLARYSPNTPLVILTDRPEHFSSQSNVLAFKHSQQSLGCYHDKRFVLEKALSLFDSCIFVDADVRFLEPIPQDIVWMPGITAHTVWKDIPKHNKNQFEINLLQRIAGKLNLNLEKISFVLESLFVVTKDNGKEQAFLQYWHKIALFLELNGFCRGEGHTIGLAAAMAGLEIRQDILRSLGIFKDKIKIPKNPSSQIVDKDLLTYLEQLKKIEYPQENFIKKVIKKIQKGITYYRCFLLLKIKTLAEYEFYYRS